MKKFVKLSCISIAALLGACTSEMPVEIEEGVANETNVCRMTFESPKPSFEGTSRANDEEWENGDCIYLKFVKADESIVTGKAVYDATDEIWNLEYKGTLPSIENAKCVASYFEDGVTEDAIYVNFSATTGIYYGVGQYTKYSNSLNVNATLLPYQSRIRFTGKTGTKFQISGPLAYISFNKEKFIYYYVSTTESNINSDGSSPYIYLTLYGTDREVSISYDNLSFITTCESPILDDGKSGYMNLPTRESHNGWEMKETAAPTLGETSVSNVEANSADFSSSIISDGNASITDCGFVYSLSQNATLDNMTIKCSVSSFKGTVSDLTKNTTYYVRAYATNSVGTAYGPETSFTTSDGSIPVSNRLSALYQFEGNYNDSSENDNNGFGVGSPEFVEGVRSGRFALKLNSTSYMQVPSSLHDKTQNSVSFWIKDPSDGQIFRTIVKASAEWSGPIFCLEKENGFLRYTVTNLNNAIRGQKENVKAFTHKSLNDGQWHHIVLVCNWYGNSSALYWSKKLYIDGVLADQSEEKETIPSTADYGLKFQLGGERETTPGAYPVQGVSGSIMTIDNFRTYTKCLSEEEIKEIYEREK